MKIAVLTSGILPVPAVLGGAVENLIDFYLDHNDRHKLHEITVFSIYNSDVEKHPALTLLALILGQFSVLRSQFSSGSSS